MTIADASATFDATITTAGALKGQGAPIEIAFSTEDETPVFTVTCSCDALSTIRWSPFGPRSA